ncbi:matrilin-4-like [Lingula anatina]|uniref:Matrilin-4-like n=1 Tax=Lingula anatina TaxID=7574 RepID=A0A2R2MQT0_LINAN|nr:matrilin-4-like [Lingula anatina]|eukprot:XP_023932357.1 matrilin-4-like [Lingula anatina]
MLSRARSRWGADRMFSGVIGAFLVLSWVKVCSGQLGDHQKIYLEVNNTRGALCKSPRLDIVFIIDESRSIWEPDFKKQLQFLSRVTEDLTIGPDDIQIGALTFATYTTDHFYLNTYKTQKDVRRALSYIRQLNTGRTNTHLAIQRVREKYFLPEKGARKNVPKVAIVITDGESREPKDTAREAAQARTEGILMIAIGVGRKFSIKELNAIASNRPGIMGKFVFTVEEYGALDEVRFEIAKVMCSGQESQALSDVASTWGAWSQWTECSKTCGGGSRGRSRLCEGITERCEGTAEDVEPCNPTPCAEWTTWSPWSPCPVTCGQGQAVRRRKCQNGAPGVDCVGLEIEGKTCFTINCRKPGDPCQTQKIDLVFVVDESTSIWQPNFMKQLKFLSRITEDFEIGQNATQIGVLTFATNARDQFYLNKYRTGKEVREAIKKIVQPDTFSTNTHKAINLMRMDYFLSKNGDRPDVPNVAVVITDGKSRNQLATKKEAAEAKNQGITMVAVGIGKQYSLNELRNIASDHAEMPGEKMVFTVENYDTLADLKEQISRIVCPDKPISQPGWGKWTMCSKTCDGGIRTRRCDGAVEQCRGRAQEIQPCNTNPCRFTSTWLKKPELLFKQSKNTICFNIQPIGRLGIHGARVPPRAG